MILDNKEFEIFAMNYSLAQRKDIDDIDTSQIEKQWYIYQKFKSNNIERNIKYKIYEESLIKQKINVFN